MATVAFGIVGGAIGGAYGVPQLGYAIGAGVGALVDNFLLFPALFPKPDIQGPRVGDLQTMTAAEGTPIKEVLGPRTRISGTIIWMSDLIESSSSSSAGKGGGGQKVTSYSYSVDIAVALCDTRSFGPISRVLKIFGDAKAIYDNQPQGFFETIAIYDGSQTTPDPLMVSYKGTGNVPNYKNMAFFVIKGLQLTSFGNRVPNLTAIVEQDPDMSVGEAVAAHVERCGFDSSEYDTSRIPACFKGQVISGPQSGVDCLNNIMMAYSLGKYEADGALVFLHRGEEDELTLTTDDLAAREEGSEVSRYISFVDGNDYELPRDVTVQFISTENDLQSGSVNETIYDHGSEQTITLNTGLTLKPIDADAIALKILWTSAAERKKVSFTLPPSFVYLKEGTVVNTTIDGITYRIYCSEITRGANYLIEVNGVLSEAETYEQEGVAASSSAASSGDYLPTDTFAVAFDAAPMLDELCDMVGLYYAVCADDSDATWKGATIYSSTDDTTYTQKGTAATQAVLGLVVSPPGTGPTHGVDTLNTIVVQVKQGSLDTCSHSELISGLNQIAVQHPSGEWEIIGFQVATLVDENQYQLSTLLRGLRGTEHLVDGHVSGLKFVLMRNDNSVNFYNRGLAGLGSSNYYKFPMYGGLVSDYESQQSTIKGITKRPFAPCRIEGVWDSTTFDFTLTWTRRSKKKTAFCGLAPLATDEQPERYQIEFRAGGSEAPVLRTVTVSGATTYTYTEADQTTDGLSAGSSPITVAICQLSNDVGKGLVAWKRCEP